MRLDAESASVVPVRWLTKVFVVGDVISFLLQCAGIFPSPVLVFLSECLLINA